MLCVILISLILLFMFMRNQTKDLLFPGCLFNLVWLFVLVLYILNFGELYDVSDKTYMYIYLGLMSTNIPFIFSSAFNGRHCRIYPHNRCTYSVVTKDSKVLLLFQIMLIAAMIPFTIKMVGAGNSLGLRRQIYATNTGSIMSYSERLVYIYFGIFPAISAQLLITVLLLFKGYLSKSLKIAHGLLAVTLITLRIVSDGGRMVIVDTVLCVFLAMCFAIEWKQKRRNLEKTKEQNKTKRRVILIVIVAVVASIAITKGRASRAVSPIEYTLRMAARYYTIGPRLFEQAITYPSQFGLDTWNWGGIFWGGLLEIPRSFFAVLGISFPSFFTIAQQEMGQYYQVGIGLKSNAFPTMFYYFMKDFGVFGVFFESFLFGCISVIIYRSLNRKPNITNYVCYYLVLLVIAYGMCWWPLYRPEYFSTVIYFLIFSKLLGLRFVKGG